MNVSTQERPTRTLSSLSDFAKNLSTKPTDYTIIEFFTKTAPSLKLFPSQRFLLKLFVKEELDDTVCDIEIRDKFNEHIVGTFTEIGFYDYLKNEKRISLSLEDYYNNSTVQFQLIMGRRASKSSVISFLVAYKLYQVLSITHPQKYFNILEEDNISVTLTALGEDNAKKLLKKIIAVVKSSTFFKPYMRESPSDMHLRLWTQHDIDNLDRKSARPGAHTNTINVYAHANSPSVRGDNNIIVIMEELAHYNKSASSKRDAPLDETIYDALTPSVSGFSNPDGTPFGLVLELSSPHLKRGKFYEDYTDAFELGVDSYSLSIQAPTWEFNPIVSPVYLRSSY